MANAITAKPYISSKKMDHLFIIGAPLIALLAIFLACTPRAKSGYFIYDPQTPIWLSLPAVLLTHSHIVLVFLRSHLNQNIFQQFRLRFTLIPIILLLSMWASHTWFGIMAVLAIYWDEVHSVMQTFGFGRIYDSKLGNEAKIGRNLDIGLSFVLGLFPHLITLTFIPESSNTQAVQQLLGLNENFAVKYGHYIYILRAPLIIFGLGYIAYYYLSYKKLIHNGYQYSKLKLFLFITTGLSATLVASFYTIVDAIYFGNIYHALQYYFIVYISEGRQISNKFSKEERSAKSSFLFYCMLIIPTSILIALLRRYTENINFLAAFWIMTSLLHFWYDGFIWSVRKGMIKTT